MYRFTQGHWLSESRHSRPVPHMACSVGGKLCQSRTTQLRDGWGCLFELLQRQATEMVCVMGLRHESVPPQNICSTLVCLSRPLPHLQAPKFPRPLLCRCPNVPGRGVGGGGSSHHGQNIGHCPETSRRRDLYRDSHSPGTEPSRSLRLHHTLFPSWPSNLVVQPAPYADIRPQRVARGQN